MELQHMMDLAKIKNFLLGCLLFLLCSMHANANFHTQTAFIDTLYKKYDCLDSFEGTWHYKKDSVEFTVKLLKLTRHYDSLVHAYFDDMIGWYEYKVNGQIKEGIDIRQSTHRRSDPAFWQNHESMVLNCTNTDSLRISGLTQYNGGVMLTGWMTYVQGDKNHMLFKVRQYEQIYFTFEGEKKPDLSIHLPNDIVLERKP